MPRLTRQEAHALIDADEEYVVRVCCPQCKEVEAVAVVLTARLERTRREAWIGVKFRQEKALHLCGQTTLAALPVGGGQLDYDEEGA